MEEEQRARDEARESYNMAERRCTVLGGEVEELRNALEGVSIHWRSSSTSFTV